jgi:crossover junction endodeoxyribonuclease RuvC
VLGTYQPQAAAVELLYFTRNVKTAISVAQARGVILEQLWSAGLQDISEYTPTMVKQVLVGTGTASKANVQALVSQILGLSGVLRPDDVADAVAIALVRCRPVRALPEVAN